MDDHADFRFSYAIEVRYGDLDAQGHVNNAKFLTFMEAARFKYFERLGMVRKGMNWDDLGVIIAEVQCTYRAPVTYPETLQVYLRTSEIGNKSFAFEYRLERASDGVLAATGRSVQVAYDYPSEQTMRVPDEWRERIRALEGREGL